MKFFKTLEILSDGSCIFSYKSTIATKNRLITLLKNEVEVYKGIQIAGVEFTERRDLMNKQIQNIISSIVITNS